MADASSFNEIYQAIAGAIGAGGGGAATWLTLRIYFRNVKEKAIEAKAQADEAIEQVHAVETAVEKVAMALKGVDGRVDVMAATCPITHQAVSEQLNRIEGLLQGMGDQHRETTVRLHDRLDSHEASLARHQEQLRHLEKHLNGASK